MLKQTVLIITTGLIMVGCGAMYVPPKPNDLMIKKTHSQSKIKLLNQAKQILMMKGYSIQSYDNESGLISTSRKKYKLMPEQANCGETMGIDYLKDYRTQTQVAINVFVTEKSIVVKSMIDGYYKPGAVEQDIDLTCVSKGVIEEDILNSILVGL